MLNSEEIHAFLKRLGVTTALNQPSYAYEYSLGGEQYLYVKRKDGSVVRKSPLVLHPSTKSLQHAINQISGLSLNWDSENKNTSFRRFPKPNGGTNYGIDADVEHESALSELIALLTSR